MASALPPVSLNIDLGETDNEAIELIDAAHILNVACNAHAGSESIAGRVLDLARERGRVVFAHPGYPDRVHFGRRSLSLSLEALRNTLVTQARWLYALATERDLKIRGIKFHGALYHDVNKSAALADVALSNLRATLPDLEFAIGPEHGAFRDWVSGNGLQLLREGFADRGEGDDGSLLPRTHPNALLVSSHEVHAKLETLLRWRRYDTVCIHGDSPNAVQHAQLVRHELDRWCALKTSSEG